jgi:acyl-coenzyme A synthetase/AMP-(fatty) acid ligase
LIDELFERAEPHHPVFRGAGGLLTWGEARVEVQRRARALTAGRPVAITAGGREGLLDLLAAGVAGAVPLLGRDDDLPVIPEGSGVVLFTSGTSGKPKAALHRWETLLGRVHQSPSLASSRWLLAYPFTAFAGLQVVLTALANGATLVLAEGDPGARLGVAGAEGATHISATPTFFRLALATASEGMAAFAPQQLTLGGEVVDQPVLDALRARFPAARITHIYASTEMGTCFSVHDGRAGFPAAWLDSDATPVRLRVEDGELMIKSPFAMRGYVGQAAHDGGWYRTGDHVQIEGDRVFFGGRAGERINVGGRKVAPARVEEAVLAVPGVAAVRVSGRPSSLAGQLVQAHVVLAPGVEAAPVRLAILEHTQKVLQSHEVPRTIRFVPALEQTASGKLFRGESQ